MHRTVAAALLAVLALGAASCGGSQKTLTGAELVRQIEVACREGQKETQRQQRGARGTGGAATLHFLNAVLAGQRVVIGKIDGYDTTGASKAAFDELRQAMHQRLALFQRVQSAGAAHVQSAITSAQSEGEVVSRRIGDAVARLGVTGCG